MNIFYTYIYLDPRKPGSFDYGEFHFDFEPFYVGKGAKEQWSTHLISASSKTTYKSYRLNKIRKIQSLGLEPKIIKYKDNLTEQEAFDLEKKLIKVIGRADLRLGPLTNLTDGGEGISGLIYSKESRQKMSEKKKGRTKETDIGYAKISEKLKGRTAETDLSIVIRSEKMTGRTAATDPGLARMAEKLRGRKLGTKENTPWIARRAEKMKGRTTWIKDKTAETNSSVARMAEKKRGNGCASKIWNIVLYDGTKQTIKNLAKFGREMGFRLGKDFQVSKSEKL